MSRYRFWPYVTQRDINVTNRYFLPSLTLQSLHVLQSLPILIKGLLNRYLKFYLKKLM
jgi:hypothetical protein